MPIRPRRTAKTEATYATAVRRFFEVAGDEPAYTEEAVAKAAGKLEARFKPSYVALILSVCKTKLADRWPKGIVYEFDQSTISKPKLANDEIAAMVSTSMALPAQFRAYLYLSTVYGLRCSELASVRMSDIDYAQGTVFVRTKKGGRQLHQPLPSNAKAHIEGMEFAPCANEHLRAIFRSLQMYAGVKIKPRQGWHSVRRALVTELSLTDINPLRIHQFMRWSLGSIMENYITGHQSRVCQEIFRVHPYIPLWEAA